jgi:hypothetical protein
MVLRAVVALAANSFRLQAIGAALACPDPAALAPSLSLAAKGNVGLGLRQIIRPSAIAPCRIVDLGELS